MSTNRRSKAREHARGPDPSRQNYTSEEIVTSSTALRDAAVQLRFKLPIASNWKAAEVVGTYEQLRVRYLRLELDVERAGLNIEHVGASMLLARRSLEAVRSWLEDFKTLQHAIRKCGAKVNGLARRVSAGPMRSLWYRHRRYKALRHDWNILQTLARAMGVWDIEEIDTISQHFTVLENHFRNIPSKKHTVRMISRLGLTTLDLQVLGFAILSCECTYCHYSCNPGTLRRNNEAVEERLFEDLKSCACRLCEITRNGLTLFGTSFLGSTKEKRRWATEILTRLGRKEHNN